jgi:hypothetical protein
MMMMKDYKKLICLDKVCLVFLIRNFKLDIDDKKIVKLCKCKGMQKLKIIKLSNNKLTNKGVIHLLKTLYQNYSLQ